MGVPRKILTSVSALARNDDSRPGLGEPHEGSHQKGVLGGARANAGGDGNARHRERALLLAIIITTRSQRYEAIHPAQLNQPRNTTASTTTQPLPALSSSTGLRSRLITFAAGSSISSPILTMASHNASTSIGTSPRTPANNGAIRSFASAALASSFENGGNNNVVSRKISTYLPPSPTATTATMTPSKRAPCLRMIPSICAHTSPVSSRLLTPSFTNPSSDLCAISAEHPLTTT